MTLLRKGDAMSVRVRNGTPIYGPPLCETCVHAHIERGYRESETAIICQATWPEHRVRFRVRECSGYLEARRQNLKQMEDMAWVLRPRDGKKITGFVRSDELPDEHQIEIELDKSK
jgi:hypothetical protein